MLRSVFLIFFQVVFCLDSFALSGEHFYVIKKNEYATQILYRAGLKPLYKKRGTLSELIDFNKSNFKNIDKLVPGQKIYFSGEQVDFARSQGLIQTSLNREIIFTELAYGIEAQKKLEKQQRQIASDSTGIQTKDVAENTVNQTPQQNALDAQSKSNIEVHVGLGYSSIDGKDKTNKTTAQFLGKINTQIQLNWAQNWSSDTQSSIYFGYKFDHFESQYLSTNIYNSNIETNRFGLSVIDKSELFQKPLYYIYNVEYGTRIFYRGISNSVQTGLELNTVPIAAYGLGFKKPLFQNSRYDFGTQFLAHYLSGTNYQNYNVNNGFDYKAGLYFKEKLNDKEFICAIDYQSRQQDTSLLNFKETNIDSSCQFQWSY